MLPEEDEYARSYVDSYKVTSESFAVHSKFIWLRIHFLALIEKSIYEQNFVIYIPIW